MALYEIVPNLSEGRDMRTIDAAVAAVQAGGAQLLHRTSDAVHHRSVLTIVGNEAQLIEAALALAGVACERIDLRTHRGVHPRIGALDVLPFIPLRGASMEDAVRVAQVAGTRIWETYRIPVFFYGAAASTPARTALSHIRRGEFEGLEARYADPALRPDIGSLPRHPSAGAVAIGAREILVAFNIELATGNLAAARAIARALRQSGGGFQTLRALAFQRTQDRVQVSLNVTDVAATPLARILETVRLLAARYDISIARGELIGCLPRQAVEDAARYYLGVP
ncbi:MAG: glutamate formimidoyltransferase [Vulcanimicrobiaceae bacterium]